MILVFPLPPSHPSPSCLCRGVEVNHGPALWAVASTQDLPRPFCAGAVTFQGCCDGKHFPPLRTRNGCQGQRAQTTFHGVGTYFGAYPGGWKESCPWVTLGIFKYSGPEMECPGAPRLKPAPEPLSCSWLYKLAGCQDHLWRVQCWWGVGGWRWGSTSVLQMRAAKSFRNEGELMKMI